MQNNNNPQPGQPVREIWKGHYHQLVQAVAVAVQYCWVWRKNDTQQPITVKELYDYAVRFDEETPLHRPQFFMVTREGAIGFSEGYEFLTRWQYIPMEAGPERDRLIEDMRWQLKAEAASEQAVEKAVQEAIAADKARAAQRQQWQQPQPQGQQFTQQPPQAAQPQPQDAGQQHCQGCGTSLRPGQRFCHKCGREVF